MLPRHRVTIIIINTFLECSKCCTCSIRTEQTTYLIKTKQTNKTATSKKRKKKAGCERIKGHGPNIK